MSAFSGFASGFGLSAALIVAIGAQNAFVLRQGLRREHVGVVVGFCAAADVVLVTAGVAGGAVLHADPAFATALTLAGAAFLVWYGLGALRRAFAPGKLLAEAGSGATSLPAVLGRTAAFTFLNPHVYIDTVLLMGTVGDALAPGARPLFVAGAGTASAIWFAALGFGARLLAPWFTRPIAWRVLDALVAATMLGLAAALAFKALGL
ncbi:MAG: LysE family transporter [Rhodospirillales bacterium]|jgi:L-lysine exporter family protein LysE/ArgO|nr:LysE family transporter [Rhodospirillales bacterium]